MINIIKVKEKNDGKIKILKTSPTTKKSKGRKKWKIMIKIIKLKMTEKLEAKTLNRKNEK